MPGGSRTLWTAMKGFSPTADFLLSQASPGAIIRRKPRSFTARTVSVKPSIRMSSLISSGTAFGPSSATTPGQRAVLRVQSCGQPLGVEGYAVRDSGLEPSPSHAGVVGRYRPADQSAASGLDCVLRSIRTIGAGSSAEIRQSEASGLGDAQVQAPQCERTW